mgnify:CR=1 FL=1
MRYVGKTKIKPEYVMIYPIDRGTPVKELEKVSENELNEIAKAEIENESLNNALTAAYSWLEVKVAKYPAQPFALS